MSKMSQAEVTELMRWQLLELKMAYYYDIPEDYLSLQRVCDTTYDFKEKEFIRRKRIEEPDFKYEVVGFPHDTEEGKMLISFATYKYISKHGKRPDWFLKPGE